MHFRRVARTLGVPLSCFIDVFKYLPRNLEHKTTISPPVDILLHCRTYVTPLILHTLPYSLAYTLLCSKMKLLLVACLIAVALGASAPTISETFSTDVDIAVRDHRGDHKGQGILLHFIFILADSLILSLQECGLLINQEIWELRRWISIVESSTSTPSKDTTWYAFSCIYFALNHQ